MGSAIGSFCAENQFDMLIRFDTIPACDGRPYGHRPTAYTALYSMASRGNTNAENRTFSQLILQ